MAEPLEAGRLYQVRRETGWVIAEYVKEIAAHSEKYSNLYFGARDVKIGREKTRQVPLSHAWRKISWTPGTGTVFILTARGMETRPCSEDAIATIATLRAEVKRLEDESQAKRRELKEFCS